jgi:hypothetical protein
VITIEGKGVFGGRCSGKWGGVRSKWKVMAAGLSIVRSTLAC